MNGGSDRGFTLTESLVVMALLSMLVLAAWPLWDQTQRVLKHVATALRSPDFEFAAARMRVDVQGARALGTLRAEWTGEPLVLLRADGKAVRMHVASGSLLREELDTSGSPMTTRVVFPAVSSWRWRAVTAGLVDVEVVHPGRDRIPIGARDAVGKRGRAPVVTERLRFALRGGEGGRTW